MDYPYYKCMECEIDIAELSLPIHPAQQYPKCPQCKTNDKVDIALGDENTKMDSETIIYSENREEVM